MTKRKQQRYEALYQRITDIYSGAIGAEWNSDEYFVGAEELSLIAPAISECLLPEFYVWRANVGPWLSYLGTPEKCTDWLWRVYYEEGAED